MGKDLNNNMIDILNHIKSTYGDDVFSNALKTNYILQDLAPHFPKERIQIRNILELGGYDKLKNAGSHYALIRKRLVKSYILNYYVDASAAAWAVDALSAVLGLSASITPSAVKGTVVNPLLSDQPQQITLEPNMNQISIKKPIRLTASKYSTARQPIYTLDWTYKVKYKNGFFYIIGYKKDGTILKSKVDSTMLSQLGRAKVLLLFQLSLVQTIQTMAS